MSEIKVLVDKIADLFGYHKMKEKALSEGRRTIRFDGTYEVEQALTDCYNFLQEPEKDFMCLIRLFEVKNELVKFVNTIDISDIESSNFEMQDNLRQVVRELLIAYKKWKEEEYNPRFEFYKKSHLFKDDELGQEQIEGIDPSIFLSIDTAVRKQLFKTYVFKDGEGSVNEHTKYHIYPTIGISHSLEEWFEFIEKQKDVNIQGDEAIITLFYKLDYVSMHYNSFVISIHQKDSIWISTDQIAFYNPRNKKTSRRAERHREEHYRHIGLPYELDEEIEEIRNSDKRLATDKNNERIDINLKKAAEDHKAVIGHDSFFDRDMCAAIIVAREELQKRGIQYNSEVDVEVESPGSTFMKRKIVSFRFEGRTIANVVCKQEAYLVINITSEILFKDFTDIHAFSKMYFIGLASRLFDEICSFPPQEKIMLAHKFIDQKLIEGSEFSHNEEGFDGYQESVQNRVEEILESIDAKETALVLKKDFTSVTRSSHYERNWLATPKSLNSLAKWTVLEDERENLQKKVNAVLKDRHKEDGDQLQKMLENRKVRVLPILFASKEPHIVYGNYETFSSDKSKSGKRHFITDFKDKKKVSGGYRTFSMFYNGDWRKPLCQCCDAQPVGSILKAIQVRHWKQLLMIMDIRDRMELPLYFRNYRAHDQIPYHGNSILNNTHPYALLRDPCSEENPNGLTINVYMCKRCYNGFEKKYSFDKKEILFDLDRNIIEEDLEEKSVGSIIKMG